MSGASYLGGIRRRPLAWGGSYPLGHLEFDTTRLRIWGLSWIVDASRDEVRGIRFRPFVLSHKVSVVYRDGTESKVYFATLSGPAIERALRAHGWPIIEG